MKEEQTIQQKAEATYSAFSANNMFKPALIEGFIDGASWMQGEGERQWISVKDRLPEDDQEVFISTQRGKVYQVRYCSSGEEGCKWLSPSYGAACDDYIHETYITHWMKLPLPPKPQTEQL